MFKKKMIPIVLLLLSTLLAACRGATPAGGTPTAEAVEPTSAPTVPSTVEFTASGPATCTVVSQSSEEVSEIEKMFPPVTDADWIHGPETASVTIIEYSDFQ